MHIRHIRRGSSFVDRYTGDIVEIRTFRKAKPTWFVTFLIQEEEKALSYLEFRGRFVPYMPRKEKRTTVSS